MTDAFEDGWNEATARIVALIEGERKPVHRQRGVFDEGYETAIVNILTAIQEGGDEWGYGGSNGAAD